jgi:thiol:disulfide interchange protein DsbD
MLRRAQGRERGVLPMRALAVFALISALALPLLAPRESGSSNAAESGTLHEPWTPARFAALRDEGRPVLVNMTADWCITCLANERVALSSTEFADSLQARGVVYLKGDWTRQDADITAYLESFGRSGVPLYVLYPAQGEPIVLPQLLTPAIVREALEALPPAAAGG